MPLRCARFWRERAEEARTVAESMSGDIARRTMFAIAEQYEVLAAKSAAAEEKRRASSDMRSGRQLTR